MVRLSGFSISTMLVRLLVLWVWCFLVRRRSLVLAWASDLGLSRLVSVRLLVAFSNLDSKAGLRASVVVCPLVSGELFLHKNRVMQLNSSDDVNGDGSGAAILMACIRCDVTVCTRLIRVGMLNMLRMYL